MKANNPPGVDTHYRGHPTLSWLTRYVVRGCAAVLAGSTFVGMCLVGYAETVYVDKSYGPGGDGSKGAPYDSIQAAIKDFNSSEIIIYPGTYKERILITKDLRIAAYDGPNTTLIDASSVSGQEDVVVINRGLDVWIEGLKVSGGRYGIVQPTQGTLHLLNCIVCNASSHGLWLSRTEQANSPSVFLYNNVFVANAGSGVFLEIAAFDEWGMVTRGPKVTAYNNVFISNGAKGIGNSNFAGEEFGGWPLRDAEAVVLDYNDCVGNVAGNYGTLFGTGNWVAIGSHSVEVAPAFVGGPGDLTSKDFRLLPTSPLKDAGNPGLGWLDPDGTRNDIGAFGGPAARTFYTNPNDGPMVREVRIDKGLIPKGETFTIRAKGAVR